MSSNTNLSICLYFLYIVVCLIGCLSLQQTKAPWNYVTKAIEMLDNEEIRSHFIKDLEALYHKYKYGSEEFYLKLTDLVISNVNVLVLA